MLNAVWRKNHVIIIRHKWMYNAFFARNSPNSKNEWQRWWYSKSIREEKWWDPWKEWIESEIQLISYRLILSKSHKPDEWGKIFGKDPIENCDNYKNSGDSEHNKFSCTTRKKLFIWFSSPFKSGCFTWWLLFCFIFCCRFVSFFHLKFTLDLEVRLFRGIDFHDSRFLTVDREGHKLTSDVKLTETLLVLSIDFC